MHPQHYTHPPALVMAPERSNSEITLKELRKAIPKHCFEMSYITAISYLVRDLTLGALLMAFAIQYIPRVDNILVRYLAWILYGYIEGLIFTGLWVLAHDCGHMAFSPSPLLNNIVGFTLHSFLLTPYFSWQSTHRRHHVYANNLTKDHNYVPPQWEEYVSRLHVNVERFEELTEDSPIVSFFRLILQQILGFPWYILFNITAGPGSLRRSPSSKPLGNSHLYPKGPLFRESERMLVVLSDLGLIATGVALWYGASAIGLTSLCFLYFLPYMWVNHWIVAITYLHHTHPAVPKYEDEAWTFLKGATATIDRDFGWIGKHLFHGIIEFHVVHHLFPRIPFYHIEEATNAVVPLLGASYHVEKQRGFLASLWESFTKCQWVEADNVEARPEDRAMWFKQGPSPFPVTGMTKRAWGK